jgi:predicted enzyme related to lactoylglutathione lyase
VGNAVVHFEVGAADDGLHVRFYGEIFGWSLRGSPGGNYTMIDTCGLPGGGHRTSADRVIAHADGS